MHLILLGFHSCSHRLLTSSSSPCTLWACPALFLLCHLTHVLYTHGLLLSQTVLCYHHSAKPPCVSQTVHPTNSENRSALTSPNTRTTIKLTILIQTDIVLIFQLFLRYTTFSIKQLYHSSFITQLFLRYTTVSPSHITTA